MYVYENGVAEQLTEEKLQSISQLLTDLKTRRIPGHGSRYCMDDYPISLLAYDLGTSDQNPCMILLG